MVTAVRQGFILALVTIAAMPRQGSEYVAKVQAFRKEAETELTRENGWLSVVGLCWIQDGQTIGMTVDAKGHPVIPCPPSKPSTCGFTRNGDRITLTVSQSKRVVLDGKPVEPGTMPMEGGGVSVGPITMTVIRRGSRIGIRVFDNKSKAREEFRGRKWFAVDPAYRISAKYVAYETPRTMPITNVLGDTQPVPNPGYVEFSLHGQKCRLEAEGQGEGLFFNFSDKTSGRSTYPAGRFLDAPKPESGMVTLDFNQATNPPCAFTAFATCPLPPSGNALPVDVKAGEKTHHPKE